MFLVAIVLMSALAVPLFGGRLSALADVRARLAWILMLALGLQVVALTVPGVPESLRPLIQLASYPIAMSANGGVMPASAAALDKAGLPLQRDTYANSALVRDPRLGFLGDVFAIPEPVPLHNVFSVGDVTIGVGVIIAVHGLSGSRLRVFRQPGRHLRRRRYRGRHERAPRGRDPAH